MIKRLIFLLGLFVFANPVLGGQLDSRVALSSFLENKLSNSLILTERSRIESIILKSEYGDENLRYRIRSSDCTVDVVFQNNQFSINNITCLGRNPEATFMLGLESAVAEDNFIRLQQTAYLEDELGKEVILDRSIRELQKRLKLGEIKIEDARKLFDRILTVFFCSGYSVSGGFVNNGEIKQPLMEEILEKLSYKTVKRVYDLRKTLGFEEE